MDKIEKIEQIRVFAAVAVVALHVGAQLFHLSADPFSVTFHIANFIDSGLRWCVPFFVMVSGSLLLSPRPQMTIDREIFHLLRKLLFPLVFWTVIFLAWATYHGAIRGPALSAGEAFKSLLQGRPYFHLWYLYMLVGLYSIAPLLRRVLKYMSNEEKVFFTVATLSYGMASQVLGIVAWSSTDFFSWFLPYVGYFLAGHLFTSQEIKLKNSTLFFFFVVAWGCTYLFYFFASIHFPERRDYFYNYLSITVVPMSLSGYAWIQKCELPASLGTQVAKLGIYTFGVYLIHPIWLGLIYRLELGPTSSSPLIWTLATTCVVLCLSFLSTYVLKSMPGLRRVV